MARVLLIGNDVVQARILAWLLEQRQGPVCVVCSPQGAVDTALSRSDLRLAIIVLSSHPAGRSHDDDSWLHLLHIVQNAIPTLVLSNSRFERGGIDSSNDRLHDLVHLGLPQSPSAILNTADRLLALASERVPVTDGRCRHTHDDPTGEKEQEKRPRILVVDDDAMVSQVTAELLRALDYEVTTALDGDEAVAYCRESSTRFDLVLLDLLMPGMDGRTCFTRLREIDPSLNILISTGSDDDDSLVKHLMQNGAVGVVQKPYDIHELAKAVGRALHRSIPDSLSCRRQQVGLQGYSSRP